MDLLLEVEQPEVCAHLASMLENPRFQAAPAELLLGEPEIPTRIVEFIGAISVDGRRYWASNDYSNAPAVAR